MQNYQVGYETTNNSNDPQLKEDMPPALRRVEDSCGALLDASSMIQNDPYSSDARARLIEGSRGECLPKGLSMPDYS